MWLGLVGLTTLVVNKAAKEIETICKKSGGYYENMVEDTYCSNCRIGGYGVVLSCSSDKEDVIFCVKIIRLES